MINNRIVFLDYAKAIGIALVVIGHVFRGLAHDYVVPNYYLLNKFDSIIYTFHMPLFFFISGLFFFESFQKKGAFNLVLSKIDTIVYPYILWRFIQGLPMVFLASYGIGHHQLTYEILFSVWRPITQFWFLYDLFLMFVFSAIIFRFFGRRIKFFLFGLSCIIYIFQLQLKEVNILFLNNFSENYVYFLLGVVIVDLIKNGQFFKRLNLFIICIIFIVFQYYYHFILQLDWEDKGTFTLILGVVSIFCVLLISNILAKKPLSWVLTVGKSSMSIYLMHVIFAAGIREFLDKVFYVHDFYVHLATGTLIGIIGPIVVNMYAKHLKFPYLEYAPISNFVRSKNIFKGHLR
jgi:fucose 4-O-acetylase-like acetyltransferase